MIWDGLLRRMAVESIGMTIESHKLFNLYPSTSQAQLGNKSFRHQLATSSLFFYGAQILWFIPFIAIEMSWTSSLPEVSSPTAFHGKTLTETVTTGSLKVTEARQVRLVNGKMIHHFPSFQLNFYGFLALLGWHWLWNAIFVLSHSVTILLLGNTTFYFAPHVLFWHWCMNGKRIVQPSYRFAFGELWKSSNNDLGIK